MLGRVRHKPLCTSCSRQLLELFTTGLAAPSRTALQTPGNCRRPTLAKRTLHSSTTVKTNSSSPSTRDSKHTSSASQSADSTPVEEQPSSASHGSRANADPDYVSSEQKVFFARQQFGETLPEGHLSSDEYQIYERLYGAPVAITNPEDEALLEPLQVDEVDVPALEGSEPPNTLFKETHEGDLEEVEYSREPDLEDGEELDISRYLRQQKGETAEQYEQRKALYETVARAQHGAGSLDEQSAMFQDLHQAEQLAQDEIQRRETSARQGSSEQGLRERLSKRPTDNTYPEDYKWSDEDLDVDNEIDEDIAMSRVHPLTAAGRSATNPRTLQVPSIELTEPVQRHLATTARYEHLTESAHKTFGGPLLPDSNATPRRRDMPLQQKPVTLSAFQHNMSTMDANLFMSAIMPGAYASTKSVLTEIRRRLGSQWLDATLARPGGPRILDAGAGGAAVIAWREILDAHWDVMHQDTLSRGPVPHGSSTVLAGSKTLQTSVSKLLQETTFIPRLPDFNRQRDLPAERSENEPTRKQYDLIVAPYTLYGMEEDYMKKAQVQNLWSLLDPNGGVLIILEKGIPKGFEAVAGAREVLLKHHISNPAPGQQEQFNSLIGNFHTNLEEGMIIAPCTNHTQCPMYTISGETIGRKDACTFKQRYERPPFLQRIHGAKFHNHEDINFSYIAVQRGKDLRKENNFVQNEQATADAFDGFEDQEAANISMLTLPRILNQPLKRTGHVILNVCTPHGSLEKWVTPKSFSHQAYRDARKAQWGDLWALGAKTRVDNPAREGRPKNERMTAKTNAETGELYTEIEEEQAAVKRKEENMKRRAVRMKKSKINRQPKYAKDTRKRLEGGEREDDDVD